jgi:hypothetical protein
MWGEQYHAVTLITQRQKPKHNYPRPMAQAAQQLLALDAVIQIGIHRGHEPVSTGIWRTSARHQRNGYTRRRADRATAPVPTVR